MAEPYETPPSMQDIYDKDKERYKESDRLIEEGDLKGAADVHPDREELRNRLIASIGLETGVGITADFVTAPLLASPIPGSRPLYYALNYGIGYGTNWLAQKIRGNETFDKGEAIAAGGFQVIPFGTTARGLKGVSRAALKGSTGSVVGEQVRVGIDEQRFLKPEETLSAAIAGGLIGGTLKGAGEANYLKNSLFNQIQGTYEGLAFGLGGTGGAGSMRPATRRNINPWQTFQYAKSYRSTKQLEQLERELTLNWGMVDRTFKWDTYITRSGNKRKLGAMFESVPYTKVSYDKIESERMPELRAYYAPILEDIGLRPEDFQLHHQQPILASLPGYDGLRFGSDQWWDVTEILFKKGLRAGDHERNLKPLVGGSKPSRKTVKNKKVLDTQGRFETPHSVTHKYLDSKVGPDGTLFWTQDVRDRINGVGKWANKGPDHQFRLDKWEEYAEIVLKSKQITDQAEQTFKDLYARNPALKNVPIDSDELDLVIERLLKLEEDGLVKPEILEGTWQVNQMETIVSEVTEELQKYQADFNYRAVFGRDGLMQKFVNQREITDIELRDLDKLPLSEQLESLQKYTGMTIADIDLLIQTDPNFDPIKFIKENR